LPSFRRFSLGAALMPEASNAVTISRPPEEVFAFLADGTNNARWRRGVLDISHKSGEGKGAIYTQGVKGPFGRRSGLLEDRRSWRIGTLVCRGTRACRRPWNTSGGGQLLMVTGGKADGAGPYHLRRERDVSLGAAVSIISGAI
jgi:hypothetical protein